MRNARQSLETSLKTILGRLKLSNSSVAASRVLRLLSSSWSKQLAMPSPTKKRFLNFLKQVKYSFFDGKKQDNLLFYLIPFFLQILFISFIEINLL